MATKLLKRFLSAINDFQQKHPLLAFPYAVIKKHSEDGVSYLGALITYYGFLSLFPLLLVATTVTQFILRNDDQLMARVTGGIAHYFPVFSTGLQANIQSMDKAGLALIIGTLVTIYGARGGANAFQNALNHIWQVPKVERPGFPKAALKSLAIMLGGGVGLVGAAVLSSYASSLGRVFILRLVPTLISFALLSLVFYTIFRLGMAFQGPAKKAVMISAMVAAVGVQILQSVGGYLITHELKNLSTLYGTFAIVLGLLFWIYLQVQVILYAAEIGAVRALKLWPRSLGGQSTEADKKVQIMLSDK